jgi:hypothetical protein
MTIDGLWIGDTIQFTATFTLVSTFTSSLPLLGSVFQKTGVLFPLSSWNVKSRPGQRRKTLLHAVTHWCFRVCWSDHAIATEQLPSNGCRLQSLFLATTAYDGFTILPCSRSRSHITTNSQSASQSWFQAPIREPRPIFLSPWHFL